MTNGESISISCKVVILLDDRELVSSNIVTDAGDLFYSQRSNLETPDNSFHLGNLVLGTAGNAPSKSSIYSDITSIIPLSLKNLEPGYPMRNDQSSSNSGKGANVITYKFKYASNEVNGIAINRLAITVPNPTGGSQLLMYALLQNPITKNSSQILTIFINHTFKGV